MINIKNTDLIENLSLETIAVWGIQVSEYSKDIKSLNSILCDSEKEKANSLNPHQKNVSILARGALRVLSAAYLNAKPKEILFSRKVSGKPFLKDNSLAFNISHSADWIILAFGMSCNIGVDLEFLREDINYKKISKRFFSYEEQSALENSDNPIRLFFDLWAHKEAIIKANGDRLLSSIKATQIPIINMEIDSTSKINQWQTHKIEAGSKYSAALAVDSFIANLPCYDFGGLEWEN